MRRALRVAAVALVAVAVAALALVLLLQPPRVAVPDPGLVLHHVTVVNPGAERLPDHSLVVRGDRIVEIAPTPGDVPRDAWAGATVLPGLVDLHVHHPPPFAPGQSELFALLFLAHGVTTVRDVGSAFPQAVADHAEAIRRGAHPGPRVLRCGPFVDGDPPGWYGARVVRTAAEAREAVHELVGQGIDCVKLYNELSPEAVQGVLAAAREEGLPVVAHVPWTSRLEALPGAEVQHLMGLGDGAWSLSPAELTRYVSSSRRLGIRHTPTLVTFVRAAELAAAAGPLDDPVGRLLPSTWRDVVWNPARNPLALDQGSSPQRVASMKEAVAALHSAGVPVLAGTDVMNPWVVPGASLHEELRLLAEAGLGVEGAWQAATREAGDALRVPGLGRLVAGAPADLLVLRSDASRDLAALGELELVVAAGRPYAVEALRAAVRRALGHFEGWPYRPLSEAAASAAVSWISGGAPRRAEQARARPAAR